MRYERDLSVSYCQKKLVKVSITHTSTVRCGPTNVILRNEPAYNDGFRDNVGLVLPMRQITDETDVRREKKACWCKNARDCQNA